RLITNMKITKIFAKQTVFKGSIMIFDVIKFIVGDIIFIGKLNGYRYIPRRGEEYRLLIGISILFEDETAIIFVNLDAVFTFFDMFGKRVVALIFTVQK